MFEDYTEILNQSLRPELRKLALYLKGERADITVKGDDAEWKVVLYENSNYQSHAVYLWRTASREAGLRLARHLETLVADSHPDDDLEDLVPAYLQAPALTHQMLPEELLPAC